MTQRESDFADPHISRHNQQPYHTCLQKSTPLTKKRNKKDTACVSADVFPKMQAQHTPKLLETPTHAQLLKQQQARTHLGACLRTPLYPALLPMSPPRGLLLRQPSLEVIFPSNNSDLLYLLPICRATCSLSARAGAIITSSKRSTVFRVFLPGARGTCRGTGAITNALSDARAGPEDAAPAC